jgi:peroxiredoxin
MAVRKSAKTKKELLTEQIAAAVGAENEGHWAGLIAAPITYVVDPSGIVKWAYVSDSAADRPSPVALAKAACSIEVGKEAPAEYPGKS